MAIQVGDVARVSHEGRADGQQIINTYHWRCFVVGTDTMEGAVMTRLAVASSDAYQNSILPMLNQQYTILQTMAQRVFPTISAVAMVAPNPAGNLQGLRGGSSLPNMSAAIMAWKTGLPGRSRRGRNYYAPIAEDDTTFNHLDPLVRANFELANVGYAVVLVDSALGEWHFGVYSSRPLVSPRWAEWFPAQSVMRSLIGTQRRRRVGHGL